MSSLMARRPRSATSAFTGLVGLGTGIGSVFALHSWSQSTQIKVLAVLAATATSMVLIDLLTGTGRRESTGLAQRPINPLNVSRILRKLLAFWAAIAVIAFAYWLVPEYAKDFYAPFKDAAFVVVPFVFIASPFYVAFVDRRQVEPEDSYALVGRLLLTASWPEDRSVIAAFARGWLIKAFFLPLMFVYTAQYLTGFWAKSSPFAFHDFTTFYAAVYRWMFYCDVLLAAIGYVMTLRVFDTHIRTTESSFFGWAVCIICYQPLNTLVTNYIQYNRDGLSWGDIFFSIQPLYIAWGILIIVFVLIHSLSIASFGLRFSNLTNRGIITHGPYRWVKHPSYLTKNITWWLISVPFITNAHWTIAVQSCLLLACFNLVYVARAMTEERHLESDPVYREYQLFISEHGLWAVLYKLLRRSDGSALSKEQATSKSE